jgi:NAD dependent epimerase/dehydratase
MSTESLAPPGASEIAPDAMRPAARTSGKAKRMEMESRNLRGSRVVVTGAAGFIGSHLVERLLAEEAEVTALVRYNSRNDRGWLQEVADPRLRIVAGDLTDTRSIEELVAGQEVVFHLGALIAIPYSYSAPEHVFETNVMGTLRVAQACLRAGVRRLVHTSTSEVYGTPDHVPIRETNRLKGQSPYSASKIGADKLVESFHLSFGLPAVTVRPFNTYGPRQSMRAVLPTIIVQALTRDVVELGSLWPRRDLTYVADTVDGFIRASLASGVEGETINLGAGEDVSIEELVEFVFEATGQRKTVRATEERKRPEGSEVKQLLSDNSRARELMGWTPRVSLRDGVAHTLAWVESHLDRFQHGEYVR